MKMIAGLGNPGNEYAKTKHNAGVLFVDALAGHLGASGWKQKENALVAEARIGAEKVLLVKPQTYMNESGRAIGPLMDWYKLEPEDLIVVHDDMDIPAGVVRIRKREAQEDIMALNRFWRMWAMSILSGCVSASDVLFRAGRLFIMCWRLFLRMRYRG